MRLLFWLVTGCSTVVVLAFAWAWWMTDDDTVSPHWLAQHGMYDQPYRYDPEDPSRLHLLWKIARAQHDRDFVGPER
jgi:hypothetical protein